MQNGPVPTRLVLLSDLAKSQHGSKVRFLGCVTNYSTKTAVLTLEHNFPSGNTLKALVDIKLLLSTIKTNETQIGEWVNVMGYVQPQPKQSATGFVRNVEIQAIVLWSSGPFNLERYEMSLEKEKEDRALAT